MAQISSTHLPRKKELLIDAFPSTITDTLEFLERTRDQELTQQKDSIYYFKVETWPGITLDSSYVNMMSKEKMRFLLHLENNKNSFSIFKAAVKYWLESTNNIPKDDLKAFLQPVNLHMANEEEGKYELPVDGSSSPSRGQVLPDLCQSNTSKLYHAAKIDTMVPPALLPQYSKTHPCVAKLGTLSQQEGGRSEGMPKCPNPYFEPDI